MDSMWIIFLFPAIETFSTKEALDIVTSVPRWVEEEASFGEGLGSCGEVSRVGPLEGYSTFCRRVLYAPSLCERLETRANGLHLELEVMKSQFGVTVR